MTDQPLESKTKSPERKIPYLSPSALSLDEEEKEQPKQQLKDQILKILGGLDKEKVLSQTITLRVEYPAEELRNEIGSLEDSFLDILAEDRHGYHKELAKAIFDLRIMFYPRLISSLFEARQDQEEKGMLYLHSLFTLLTHKDAILLVILHDQLTREDWLRLLQQPTQADTARPDFETAISLHLLGGHPDPTIIISFLSKTVSAEKWKELLFTPNGKGRTAPQEYALNGNFKALKALRDTVSIATWEELVNSCGTTGTSPLYLAVDRVTSVHLSELKTAIEIINYLWTTGGDRYVTAPGNPLSTMELFKIIHGELRTMSATYPSAGVTASQLRDSLLTPIELKLSKIITSSLLADLMTGNKMPALNCFYIQREIKQSGSRPIDLGKLAYKAIETLITLYQITTRGEFGEGDFYGEAYYKKLSLLRDSYIPLDSYPSEIPPSEITPQLTPEESKGVCEIINLIQAINQEIITKTTTLGSELDLDFDKVVYHPQQTVVSTATPVSSEDEKPIKGDSKIPTTPVAFFSLPPSSTSSHPASSSVSSDTKNVDPKKKRKRVEDSGVPSSPLTSNSPF